MKPNGKNIYCFDTSALVTMHRYYPNRFIPDLWNNLEELFKARRVRSHEFVYDEIVPPQGVKDALATIVSRYKVCFQSITKKQGQLVPQILAHYPHLIDPYSKKDQADPWIVAMVIELMEETSLFGKDSEFVIVSTESETSPNKIPAVCKHYNVRHMNLFEFFEDNEWAFSVMKK